jgi:hypothetical protein
MKCFALYPQPELAFRDFKRIEELDSCILVDKEELLSDIKTSSIVFITEAMFLAYASKSSSAKVI